MSKLGKEVAHRSISAEVTVAWSDDPAELYRRLVTAADASPAFRGVRKAALWQPFHAPAHSFHRAYSRAHLSIKNGTRIKVKIAAGFDPTEHVGQIYSVSIFDPTATPKSSAAPPTAPKPAGIALKTKVMDNDSVKAISGVVVQLLGSSAYAETSDSSGEVRFTGVASGDYTLMTTTPHHEPHSQNVTVSGPTSLPVILWLKPIVFLKFNGSKLCVISAGTSTQCWNAVSGRKGYQTKAHQKTKDKGPVPEGWWEVRQKQYQSISSRSDFDAAIGVFGRGTWPGGESSWGKHRIWLLPKKGTKTHGRSGFSIHGGDDPGSAGCIDTTRWMSAFVTWFRMQKKDFDLQVEY